MESPVTRIRGHGFANQLRDRGIECEVFPTNIPVRWTPEVDMVAPSLRAGMGIVRRAFKLRRSDVLYVIRGEDIPGVYPMAPLLRRLGRYRFVFDFDDAVYLTSPRATRGLCRAADAVVVTNDTLAAFARGQNPHVHHVATPVDTDRAPRKDWSATPRSPIIGWAGTPSNYAHLKQILSKPLATMARRLDFEVRIVTWPLEGIDELLPGRTRIVPWTLDSYQTEISQFDVGVSAVVDNPWTRGKMGFKLLEYMAAGVPAVGSRLFASGHLFESGKSGFYADTPEEWTDVLERLLTDASLRQQVGEAGRIRCESEFSMRVAGQKLARIVAPLLEP